MQLNVAGDRQLRHVLGKLVYGLPSVGRAGRPADARRRRGGVSAGSAGTDTLAIEIDDVQRATRRLDGIARCTPVLGSAR